MRRASFPTPARWMAVSVLLLCLPLCAARSAPVRSWPQYDLGRKEDGVRAAQYLLRARGCPVAVDGVFGSRTERAVRGFQRSHGLIANSVLNDATWESLVVPVRQGSRGPAVSGVQVLLRAEGYAVPVSGVFDAKLGQVVRRFQSRTGHTADGVVGANTWNELVGGHEEDGD